MRVGILSERGSQDGIAAHTRRQFIESDGSVSSGRQETGERAAETERGGVVVVVVVAVLAADDVSGVIRQQFR
jgi:hypothetical protein